MRSWLPPPLVVDQNSHIVVMEYKAWFGPNAVTFQDAATQPPLQSADMQSVGGGYDSWAIFRCGALTTPVSWP